MDILYIVGNFSKCDDWEFRFSLRSIDKYGLNIGRVFLCGYCPDWLSDDIIKIPYEIIPYTTAGEKNRNIYKQIIYAVENTDIGINDDGDFLISMDDHYILNFVDFGSSYPHYIKNYTKRQCKFNLPLVFEKGKQSPDYQRILLSTAKFLKRNYLTYLNFTPHRNIRVNRYAIEQLQNNGINYDIFNNNIDIEGIALAVNYEYTMRSKNDFVIEIIEDFKTNDVDKLLKYIEDEGVFYSTNDFSVNDEVFNALYSLFPGKSKYEKDVDEILLDEKEDEFVDMTSESNSSF